MRCGRRVRLSAEPGAGSGERSGGGGAVLTIGLDRPNIVTVAQTGSTNADLLEIGPQGWPEGRWLSARRQIGGRGRLGRSWSSLEGNLQASTAVHLAPGDPLATGLSLVAGVALHEALRALVPGGDFTLKWPNDVMVGTAKLAGILLERAGDFVVLGFGVNVAGAPQIEGRETIALAGMDDSGDVDPDKLLYALARGLAHWVARWRAEGLAPVREAWLAGSVPPGRLLTVTLGDNRRLEGRFLGIAPDGALLVEALDGTRHVVHAGEVGYD